MKTSRKILALLVAALVADSAFGQFAGTSATSTPVAGSPATGGPASFSTLGLGDGLVGTPSLYFTADPDTGLFRPATNTLGIAAGGVDSAWFTPTAWQGLNSLTSGIQLYNTVDTVTDVTRLEMLFSGGGASIGTRTLGIGAAAPLRFYAQTGSGAAFYSRLDLLESASFPWLRLGGYTSTTGTTKFATGNTGSMMLVGDVTIGTTAGQVNILAVTPTYNEVSGNASNTDLLINRTQTAVGSGTQRLLDLQVGGTSKFNVDNTGIVAYANVAQFTNGVAATPGTSFAGATTTGLYWANPGIGFSVAAASVGTWTATGLNVTGTVTQTGKTTTYNNVATAGMGVGVVVANPRQTAVTNATATLATYTVPASDSTYRISANVQVTAATTAAMTVVCTYTDETNTSRAQTIPFVQLAGTFLTSITNVTGTGPYEGATLQIRCKAGTTIVFTTAGTVTGITYNVEGLVIQGS